MKGIQKTVYSALQEMLFKIRDEYYGKDDDFNKEYLEEDFSDLMADI